MPKAKQTLIIVVSALVLNLLCARANAAPQQEQQKENEHTAEQEAARDLNNYRVKYKVDEVENGKTINSRSYTMMVKVGSTATVRIGNRVPYGVSKNAIQYQDVGMNIDCNISKREGSLVIHSKVAMISVVGKGAGTSFESYPSPNPVFGQFELENNTLVTIGKPSFVGSADDVVSNRRYEIQVTVTMAR